jgi:hypothetical protein
VPTTADKRLRELAEKAEPTVPEIISLAWVTASEKIWFVPKFN